ncbi:MAG: hypothetical protein AAF799_36025 [Myxococcota bacterium]
MTPLEQYFRGNDAWRSFVAAVDGGAPASPTLQRALGDDVELARVVSFIIGPTAEEWITKQVPALDGLTPIECVATGKTERLKTMLMRM